MLLISGGNDCDASGAVDVSELVIAVNIALDNRDVFTCTAVDTNGDGRITIDELVVAVGNALDNCPL